MPDSLPTIPGTPGKGFFSKPENVVALIPAIALGVVAFMFWGGIVGYVLQVAEDTLHLIVVVVVILAIFWLLFDKHVRLFLWYMYRSAIRAGMHVFVSSDDIGALETWLERMKSKREDFQKALNDINGQKIETQQQLKQDTKDYNDACAMFAAAKKANDSRVVELKAKSMARLETVMQRETVDLETLLKINSFLGSYRDTCDDTIADWSEEIKFQKREQRRSTSFSNAMRAGVAILHGMPEEDEMRDMAIEDLKQKYAAKMGEVEQAFDMTRAVVSTAQIKDGAAVERANQMLEKWQASQVTPGVEVKSLPEPEKKVSDSGYSDLFK